MCDPAGVVFALADFAINLEPLRGLRTTLPIPAGSKVYSNVGVIHYSTPEGSQVPVNIQLVLSS